MKFLFRTWVTMKPYNKDKWWITGDMMSDTCISANSMTDALKQFGNYADGYGITISKNGIRNRQPMFRDSKDGSLRQVGYAITGKTSFQKDDGKLIDQYIDLWVEVLTIVKTTFPEEETA